MENTSPVNILIISNKPPYPIIDGGCFAMAKFEQLVRCTGANVFYFSISTLKHPFKENELPRNWKLNDNFFTEFIDTGIKNKHVLKYFAGSSIRAARFYDPFVEKKILGIIAEKKIDTVIFESIYSGVYLKAISKNSGVKTYIRAHNIEHHIWEKYYDKMGRGLKKLAYKSETSRLKSFENACLENTSGNIFISDADQEYYKKALEKSNSTVIPIQMKPVEYKPKNTGSALQLFHIGAMDWLPNVEGLEYFLNEIFSSIIKKHPAIKLHLAGKSMRQDFRKYASENVVIHGEVEDAAKFMSEYDALVVPVRSGSGIRIKILEAMALGKPVVSTSVGIEGIHAGENKAYLNADSITDWTNAIDLLKEPLKYDEIAKNALTFMQQNYSETSLLNKLELFLKTNH